MAPRWTTANQAIRCSASAVVACALLVGMAGCGGGGSEKAARSRAELIKLLGVLRRPQAAADRDQALMRRLVVLESRPNCYGLPADAALIRYAAMTPWGQQVFVVPFKPARC